MTLRNGQHRLAPIRQDQPKKVGGHLLEPAGREKGGLQQALYRCQWCGTTSNYGAFSVIGQLDYCPERVDSMNGYLWFNADDPAVARTRASHQWHSHAKRAGYALVDYTEVDQPGICATFTWREQAYVVRYGEDAERGMRANDLRVELADQGAEQAGA